MRRNPYYTLKEIGEGYYLIPFGQAIEMHAPTVCVNEVAAFLWGELDQFRDIKALAGRLMEEYEMTPEEVASLEEDVRVVLRSLQRNNIVLDDVEQSEKANFDLRFNVHEKNVLRKVSDAVEGKRVERLMKIAGLTLRFSGISDYFSENFEPFCIDAGDVDICGQEEKDICVAVTVELPPQRGHLPIALKGAAVMVYDAGDFYVMKTGETPAMREAHIAKDGSKIIIYIDPDAKSSEITYYIADEWGSKPVKTEVITPADCVFHAIRHAFLLKAQTRDMYVIHSASILHDGKAWLFSALSGTGKSTHTNIWHKLYGTPYLNGDLNLVAFVEGKPVVKGIPWCGTSGLFTTKTYPLGGIILIAQDPKNFIEELKIEEKILGIQMRFISPKWNEEQTLESLDFARRVAKTARIARLHCNMEDEAAEVCREWIDNNGL